MKFCQTEKDQGELPKWIGKSLATRFRWSVWSEGKLQASACITHSEKVAVSGGRVLYNDNAWWVGWLGTL